MRYLIFLPIEQCFFVLPQPSLGSRPFFSSISVKSESAVAASYWATTDAAILLFNTIAAAHVSTITTDGIVAATAAVEFFFFDDKKSATFPAGYDILSTFALDLSSLR